MLETIRDFFKKNLFPNTSETSAKKIHKHRLAVAALLVEMTRMDHVIKEEESLSLQKILVEKLNLSPHEFEVLLTLAETEAKNSSDYYQFTSLINDTFGYSEKVELVQDLWAIAYADEHIDKYEEHLVRKISDLLYVSHSDFILAKQCATGEAN